jgi:hypothetical protein
MGCVRDGQPDSFISYAHLDDLSARKKWNQYSPRSNITALLMSSPNPPPRRTIRARAEEAFDLPFSSGKMTLVP